jgi:hypothetical protein
VKGSGSVAEFADIARSADETTTPDSTDNYKKLFELKKGKTGQFLCGKKRRGGSKKEGAKMINLEEEVTEDSASQRT